MRRGEWPCPAGSRVIAEYAWRKGLVRVLEVSTLLPLMFETCDHCVEISAVSAETQEEAFRLARQMIARHSRNEGYRRARPTPRLRQMAAAHGAY